MGLVSWLASQGRTALRWVASVGSGGFTTLVLSAIVLWSDMDLTSKKGAALTVLVGTACSWVANWAVSKTGPVKPATRPSASRGRRPMRPPPTSEMNADASLYPPRQGQPDGIRHRPDGAA